MPYENLAAELSLECLMRLIESPSETASLDFKETLDVNQSRDRVEFAKDVLAMANSGGGHVVVGIEDKTRRRVGIGLESSGSLQEAKSVNDKLKKYCGGYVKVLVAQHEIEDPAQGRVRLCLIYIPPAIARVPAQDDGVCPDPTDMKKQKWVFRRGDVYVRKGDESVKVETPADLAQIPVGPEITIDPANEIVRTYSERLANSLRSKLPPLLPNETPDEMCGSQLIAALLPPKDFFVLAASGAGKSLHLRHLCLEALKHKELPLLIGAGRYKGQDFLRLLDQAIAPFSKEPADTLFKAASICGLHLLLVIDGINECEPYLENLVKDVQALRLRGSFRLLAASQTDDLPKDAFDCNRISVSPLTPSHKRFIYCYHANMPPTAAIDYLCQGFSNGYDLAIAGRCHSVMNGDVTRVELYERYCRKSLLNGETVLAALLREIAGRMGQELTNFCPRDEFERFSEEFLLSQGASLELLDHLKSSRLVSLTDTNFEFEHELLFDYFRAEWTRRRYLTVGALAPELAKPKNESLLPFILPRYKEVSSVHALLRTLARPEALREVLLGRCGDTAREALLADCRELFTAAASDVTTVTLNFNEEKPEPAKLSLLSLTLLGRHQWTPYEVLLSDAIATSLDDHELQQGFLDLLNLTEWTLRKKADEIASGSGVPSKTIWALVVGQLGMFTNEQLPFFRIVASLRQGLMHAYRRGTFHLREQLLARINRDPTDHFSLAILLDGLTYCRPGPTDNDPDLYIRVCRLAWESRIYHLRLNALHFLHTIRPYLYGEHQEKLEKIKDVLRELKTENLFLNSSLLEVQVAYGVLKPIVSVEEITEEMRSVIAESLIQREPNIALGTYGRAAYGLLSNIFEDIYEGAYYEAYESLERDEKVALLCLAAQSECGLTTSWILLKLLNFGQKEALPAFQKHASSVDADSSSPQETTAAYALGVAGCAQFMNQPPEYVGPGTPEHKAWKIAGEILFWLLRGKNGQPIDTDHIERLWSRLASEAPLAAADTLHRINSGLLLMDSEQKREFDLIAQCPCSAKPLLEESLKNRASLTSLFRWGGNKDEGLVKFVIEGLGRVGGESAIPLLIELSDNPQFGAECIAAIRRIRGSAHDWHVSS